MEILTLVRLGYFEGREEGMKKEKKNADIILYKLPSLVSL